MRWRERGGAAIVTPPQNNEAFEWLRKAHAERSSFVVFTSWDPRFDGLRGDVRFGRWLQELGLPEPSIAVATRN